MLMLKSSYMFSARAEAFKPASSVDENQAEQPKITFENEAVEQFWTSLKPQQEHTAAHYEVFQRQLAEARLPLGVRHVLEAWNIELPETWQKTINQASLDEDGEPDFQLIADTLPAVGSRLSELYQEKMMLKIKVKENTFVFNADGSQGPFGACETRLLPAPEKKTGTNPFVLMPGCLTGAISLENTAVALAQAGYDVASCDTSAPNSNDNVEYHKNNDTSQWPTPRTAVNTAYTQSVEYAMKTYEEGLNQPADQKYNLLGYSTSAAAVLQAALLRPEKVDKIVLLAPIGLTNTSEKYSTNVLRILTHAAFHSVQNAFLGEKTQNAREYFTGYIERQKQRGWGEVPQIIWNAAVTELAEAVYQVVVEKRIPVAVILGEKDYLFDAEESREDLEIMGNAQDFGSATVEVPFEVGVLDDGYTHNHIGRDPERTALVLDSTVDSLGRVDRLRESLAPNLAK